MKKVGIIDDYVANFHSNTYNELFGVIAKEENREEYKITHIYAKNDTHERASETTDEWCARTGAIKCATIQEVCDAVDVILVLAPNSPELHEELVQIPFKSGKRVYVDKTFAPDYATAKRIADYGKETGANYWSSSAVRFDPRLLPFLKGETPEVKSVVVQGGNVFEIYAIHLVEVMNSVMKNGAKTVTCINGGSNLIMEIAFKDGRKAFYHQAVCAPVPFSAYIEYADGKCDAVVTGEDFWKIFVRALMDFFDTGVAPIPVENTVECIAVRSAIKKAMTQPGVTVEVEGAE